jgi:hypothetical protein
LLPHSIIFAIVFHGFSSFKPLPSSISSNHDVWVRQAKSEAEAEAFGEAIQAVAEKCDHLINQVARG